jgi:hypothetical protein
MIINNFVGIDPGFLGGIALVNEKEELIRYVKMPLTKERDLDIAKIKGLIDFPKTCVAIEMQTIFAKQGLGSAITTIKNWARIIGLTECIKTIHVNNYDLKIVAAITWKKYFPELETKGITALRIISKDKSLPLPVRAKAKKDIKINAKQAAIEYVNKKYGLKLLKSQDGIRESILIRLYMKRSFEETKDSIIKGII